MATNDLPMPGLAPMMLIMLLLLSSKLSDKAVRKLRIPSIDGSLGFFRDNIFIGSDFFLFSFDCDGLNGMMACTATENLS